MADPKPGDKRRVWFPRVFHPQTSIEFVSCEGFSCRELAEEDAIRNFVRARRAKIGG